MEQHWDAVARAITQRLDERGMTLTELAARSDTSLSTVRELAHNLSARRRQPRTLAALSSALGWPPSYLGEVLRGEQPTTGAGADSDDPVLAELREMHDLLKQMNQRLDHLEERVERDNGR